MSVDNERRFELWPGLSYELLPEKILNFVFHPLVRGKILGLFSGTEGVFEENRKYIYWNTQFGVAAKSSSDELIFLGASSSDIKSIVNTMKFLNIEGLLSNSSDYIRDASIEDISNSTYTTDFIKKTINIAITEIGKRISLVTAANYGSKDSALFITDHTSPGNGIQPIKRLTGFYSKDTNKGKIIAYSHFTGSNRSNVSDSHAGRIKDSVAHISNQEFTGPFAEAKMRYLMYKDTHE